MVRIGLTTGQVAEDAGVNNDTVRYYEQRGLIEEPPRTDGGYRQFPPETVRRIKFIKRAQTLGFTLAEIDDLLELADGKGSAADILEKTETKIEEIEEKIEHLKTLRESLTDLAEACPGEGPLSKCNILESLSPPVDSGNDDTTRIVD
ncbi:MAG: MerR family transcriptional regulator [bacterium]